MKKIVSITLVIIITLSTVICVSASTSTLHYFFINKCEELQVKLTFKEGKVKGTMALIDGARKPYTSISDEYKKTDDSFIYVIKRPTLGKWTIQIYGFTWDEIKLEIIEKNKEGHEYEERFGTPYMYTPVATKMRKHYIQLDTYNDELEANINETFPDVQSSYWGTPYISKLSYLNIINGRDGLFFPEDNVKVNEFLKMIICTMGYEVERNTNNWALPYIDKAKELLLIESDEYSNYDVPITREQTSKIMVMSIGLKEDLPDTNLVDKIQYDIKDYSLIDDYKKDDVLVCYAVGLITGIDGYFKPQDNLTRTQASTIIMRYINKDMRQPYIPKTLEKVKYAEIPNNQGEITRVYENKYYPKTIKSVIKLDEARKLSKGANYIRFLNEHDVVSSCFYKDIESKTRGIDTRSNDDIKLINMIVEVYTANIKEHNNNNLLYTIDSSNVEAVKAMHMETLKEMFKHWFDSEYQIPFDKLVEYLNRTTNETIQYENIYNSRKVIIARTSSGLAVRIY